MDLIDAMTNRNVRSVRVKSIRVWTEECVSGLNVLTISFVFLWVRGPAHYENTQCYFSVGLPQTLCAFVSLNLDNILSQLLLLAAFLKNFGSNGIIGSLAILEGRRILRVVSHFNRSVLANETLSVSLSLEIDVSGAVRTCFDHVLSFQVFRGSVFYF